MHGMHVREPAMGEEEVRHLKHYSFLGPLEESYTWMLMSPLVNSKD